MISHGSGISTLYSHLDTMEVTGGWVDQGEVIGTVGCTGSCSGDHLHFETHRGRRAIDPLDVLRRSTQSHEPVTEGQAFL